jgi:phage protein D
MTIATDLQVQINGQPLDAKSVLPLLCEVDVDLGVQQQGMVRLQLAAGQDASGDWARDLVHDFIPGSSIAVDVRIGSAKDRLFNGVLTQTKLNFSAEVHDSKFEITGMDVLEKVKRSSNQQRYSGDLVSIVSQVLGRQSISLDSGNTPTYSNLSESQTDSDLDFLTGLARKYNSEIYVESSQSGDTGYFQKLDFATADSIATDLRVNQGLQTNVRNAQFYIDLSAPTRVEANNVGANGQSSSQRIYSDLRDTPGLSQIESDLLGPPSFALIMRANRESQDTPDRLQVRCDSELEKNSWVVIGKGELDTAAYGDLLSPRRSVQVRGAGSLFEGPYMVWKVTHTFQRQTHCQRFELRRKLGMMRNGGS